MFAPIRALYAFRPRAAAGVLVAAAAVTALFSATPFLIPELVERYDVSVGTAGWISVVQVGSFATATIVAGRTLPISTAVVRIAAGVLAAFQLASAFAPDFIVLLVFRVGAGAAAGVITSLAWTDAMREERKVADLALVGPLTALFGALAFAWLADVFSDRGVFVALAALALPALALPVGLAGASRRRASVSGSRSNRILLLALFVLTGSGSALFVYLAVVGAEAGIAAEIVALSFSLNALGGIVGARMARRVRYPGLWMAATAFGAILTVWPGTAWSFAVGMLWWGYAFWMGVPGVLALLSERSLEPGERAGDAQGLMAYGRALGPLGGGWVLDGSSAFVLGAFAAGGLAVSGALVRAVQWGRAALPASDERVA